MLKNSLLFMLLTAFAYFPDAHSKSPPKEWLCKIKAFTEDYEAIGQTKAEASMEVTRKCKDDNSELICRNVKCEGPEGGAKNSGGPSNLGWICSLKPFTESYIAAAATRAEAKLRVMKQCEAKEDKMFCRDPKCEEG